MEVTNADLEAELDAVVYEASQGLGAANQAAKEAKRRYAKAVAALEQHRARTIANENYLLHHPAKLKP